jgi:hypothetical protein
VQRLEQIRLASTVWANREDEPRFEIEIEARVRTDVAQ